MAPTKWESLVGFWWSNSLRHALKRSQRSLVQGALSKRRWLGQIQAGSTKMFIPGAGWTTNVHTFIERHVNLIFRSTGELSWIVAYPVIYLHLIFQTSFSTNRTSCHWNRADAPEAWPNIQWGGACPRSTRQVLTAGWHIARTHLQFLYNFCPRDVYQFARGTSHTVTDGLVSLQYQRCLKDVFLSLWEKASVPYQTVKWYARRWDGPFFYPVVCSKGTGKTKTITSLILACAANGSLAWLGFWAMEWAYVTQSQPSPITFQGQRVLTCGPTNVAALEIAQRTWQMVLSAGLASCILPLRQMANDGEVLPINRYSFLSKNYSTTLFALEVLAGLSALRAIHLVCAQSGAKWSCSPERSQGPDLHRGQRGLGRCQS